LSWHPVRLSLPKPSTSSGLSAIRQKRHGLRKDKHCSIEQIRLRIISPTASSTAANNLPPLPAVQMRGYGHQRQRRKVQKKRPVGHAEKEEGEVDVHSV